MGYYECRKCHNIKSESGFYEKDGKPDLTWCIECYRRWYQERAGGMVTKACERCGAAFECTARSAKRRRFCSRECKNLQRRQRQRELRRAAKTLRPCLHCTNSIGPEMRSDAIFCTNKCREAASNLVKKMNHRGEKWGVPPVEGDYINRAHIIERDTRTCQICSEPVDLELDHPDPMYGSIDHRVPLSEQGPHTLDNLQLAHLSCNIDKGG